MIKLTPGETRALTNARDHGTPNYELGRASKRWYRMVDALEFAGLLHRVPGKATRQITDAGRTALDGK